MTSLIGTPWGKYCLNIFELRWPFFLMPTVDFAFREYCTQVVGRVDGLVEFESNITGHESSHVMDRSDPRQ